MSKQIHHSLLKKDARAKGAARCKRGDAAISFACLCNSPVEADRRCSRVYDWGARACIIQPEPRAHDRYGHIVIGDLYLENIYSHFALVCTQR